MDARSTVHHSLSEDNSYTHSAGSESRAMSSGFFRGTSVDQDSRWGNVNSKLKKKMKFAAILDTKVQTSKLNLDVINKWATERITDLLGFDDDIVIGTVINFLAATPQPDPKQLQLDVTGFLEKQSAMFVEELWTLMVDAQSNGFGIPTAFIEKKKGELATVKKVSFDAPVPISPLGPTVVCGRALG